MSDVIGTENTAAPRIRCGMCDGRCRYVGNWIYCVRCAWSAHDQRYRRLWRLRVLAGR